MSAAATRTTRHLPTEIPETRLSRFFFGDTRIAWLWTLVRLYVGWQWIQAGWDKVTSSAWTAWGGGGAGTALQGFLSGSIKQTGGAHPNVQGWYGAFLQDFVMHHLILFSHMVAYGETAVGVALILGAFTGIAAFFGCFMNMNYMLAGAVSVNPILLVLGVFLVLAWRVAGWYGADRWILAEVGTPWRPGTVFHRRRAPARAA